MPVFKDPNRIAPDKTGVRQLLAAIGLGLFLALALIGAAALANADSFKPAPAGSALPQITEPAVDAPGPRNS
ncbi:hypothetical protein GCM10011316_04420 [Roseibium aquae]|uniref:Uncharacterized protein n=1 Tax=Roseibium aquae TaxID=1323746 RepID=A0A916T872_9HYPH|nr:hypothetical protein [Roseibium aquae]GGB35414.1 hypothetical protein GCM10011316_04420 [Roseibium aquae]